MVYLCPAACKRLNLGGKKSLLCSLQRSPVCSLLQDTLFTFRNQLSFMKEKIIMITIVTIYLRHLYVQTKKFARPSCLLYHLKITLQQVSLLNFCSACPPKLLLLSSVCQCSLVSTLVLEFQRASHFLTTLSL